MERLRMKKDFSKDIGFEGQDSNLVLPKYEAEVLSIIPPCFLSSDE
jgi:hypothetical protein